MDPPAFFLAANALAGILLDAEYCHGWFVVTTLT